MFALLMVKGDAIADDAISHWESPASRCLAAPMRALRAIQ